MKKLIWLLLLLAGTAFADFKSTFLIGEPEGRFISPYSTLSWLSNDLDDNWRNRVIGMIGGDTHADIMARSTANDFGRVDGVHRDSWRNRIGILRSNGVVPVVWLISDDSSDVYRKGLNNQIDYQNQVVSAVDDIVSHYVVCLECDEYYSVPELNVVIQRLRKKTDKPIGVHLTPGMRGKEAYIKNADIIYLQTGFGKTESEFRAEIEYALTLGKPVVVSEYNLDSDSAEAKRYGDIACSYPGVVGTGNGRGNAICESLKEDTKVKFVDQYDDELAVFMLALVTISAAYGLQMNLPFEAKFNYIQDDKYEVMLAAPVNETTTVGATVNDRGRVMAFFNVAFDKLFTGGPRKEITHEK